jgi:hypothetical protein
MSDEPKRDDIVTDEESVTVFDHSVMVDLSKPPPGMTLEDFIRQIVREEMNAVYDAVSKKVRDKFQR